MSNRSARRTKSPATRNKFSEVGIAGRKTGVRVTGAVPIDADGLENVAEFYKHTSPVNASPTKNTTTLHTLVSPTPIRSTAAFGTLLGALDIPLEAEPVDGALEDAAEVDEALVTPVRPRGVRAAEESPTRAGRRVTMGARVGQEWVMSAKKGRRATMALMAVERRAAGEELDFGVEEAEQQVVRQEGEQEDDGFSIDEVDDDVGFNIGDAEPEPEPEEDPVEESFAEPSHAEEHGGDEEEEEQQELELDDSGFRIDDAEPDEMDEEHPEQQETQEPSRAQKKTQRTKPAPKQPETVRRSTRATVPPVAYWRNEHVEYEYQATDSHVTVPVVKNVVRVRQTAEEKQQAKKRRTKRTQQLPSLRGIARSELDVGSGRGAFYYYDDEHYGFPVDSSGRYGPRYTEQASGRTAKRSLDEADDNDDIAVDERPKRVLLPNGTEELREIALSRQSIQWANIDAKKDRFKVGVGLLVERDDGEVHASSGVLSIAVGGRKPPRNAGPRALFYLVTSGQVEVRVHGAVFRVGVLGQFLVPTHNTYSIANVGTHAAQLFYVHVCPPEQSEVEESAAANGAAENTAGDGEESAGDSEIE